MTDRDDLERAGRWSLASVVLGAVAVSVFMNEGPVSAPENLGILSTGFVYLGLLLAGSARLPRLPTGMRWLYYGVQLALVALLLTLQARLDSFGLAWICLMPLVVQAMLEEPPPTTAVVTTASWLLPTLHLAAVAGWRSAVEPAAGIAAALVFVVLFSATVKRQRAARRRSDELAEELATANRALARMAVRAEDLAAARERSRLAREIHDATGHSLTVAAVQLDAATLHLDTDPARAAVALGHASGAVRQGLAELRASVYALRESPLGPRGLGDALRALGGADAGVRVEVAGEPRPLPPETALALYRVAQEGWTNAHKHASGARVRIDLRYGRDVVTLRVLDDGPGPSAEPGNGYGLLGLRERLGLLGGHLETGAAPGGGFEVRAEIPLESSGA